MTVLKRPLLPGLSRLAWWQLGLAGLTMVLLWSGGTQVTEALRYHRSGILAGQFWRLLTGHLVHFDFRHLALNLAGAGLMVLLFTGTLGRRQWGWVLAASMLFIDVGFLLGEPNLEWYVGLSGVLHGVLAAGVFAWWRTETPGLAAALTLVVVGKLIWEQWAGALPLAGEMPVIVAAHLYGAIGGGLCGAIFTYRTWFAAKRARHNIT